MEERIKRSGKKPAPPAAAAPPPSQPQAKMPAEEEQELKQPKQSHHLQRHSTPVEDEESGVKEEKTIPTTKYVFINFKAFISLIEKSRLCTSLIQYINN